MDFSPFVVKAAQWLLSKAGYSLFDFFKQHLLKSMGLSAELELLTVPKAKAKYINRATREFELAGLHKSRIHPFNQKVNMTLTALEGRVV